MAAAAHVSGWGVDLALLLQVLVSLIARPGLRPGRDIGRVELARVVARKMSLAHGTFGSFAPAEQLHRTVLADYRVVTWTESRVDRRVHADHTLAFFFRRRLRLVRR